MPKRKDLKQRLLEEAERLKPSSVGWLLDEACQRIEYLEEELTVERNRHFNFEF